MGGSHRETPSPEYNQNNWYPFPYPNPAGLLDFRDIRNDDNNNSRIKKKDRINFFVDVKGLSPMNESRGLVGWWVGGWVFGAVMRSHGASG